MERLFIIGSEMSHRLGSWYHENENVLSIGLGVIVAAIILLYIVIPLIFYWCPFVQKHVVFQFMVNVPPNFDYNSLSSVGIRGGRNFYLESESDVTIGVWHILPQSAICSWDKEEKVPNSVYWDDALRNKGKGIFLYLHGNTGTRALPHRVELYNLLQKENFHVIAVDYRGFGDSSNKMPSETGSVLDSICAFNWIQNVIRTSECQLPIFVWGHSLGTGIALHTVAKISKPNPTGISGLFLEAPFSTFADAVEKHRLSKIYRFLPGFKSIFVKPLRQNDCAFESENHIVNTTLPILILHAIDDHIIPYCLGQKLYDTGRQSRSEESKPIYFKKFGEGFCHKYICRSPELPALVTEFSSCVILDDWPCYSLHSDTAHDQEQD